MDEESRGDGTTSSFFPSIEDPVVRFWKVRIEKPRLVEKDEKDEKKTVRNLDKRD